MRDIHILINGKILTLAVNIDDIKTLGCNVKKIEMKDSIISVSVADNIIIILSEDPEFRMGSKQIEFVKNSYIEKNNITAYDWDGNVLWNISDIIGEINMSFSGGCVTTLENLSTYFGFDKKMYDANSKLYACTAGGKNYIIDLDKKTVVQCLSAY